jgi:hypothetical protein
MHETAWEVFTPGYLAQPAFYERRGPATECGTTNMFRGSNELSVIILTA